MVALFLSFAAPIWAQSNAGVTLRPATVEETLDPGAIVQHTITVRNESDADQVYYLSTRDIIGVRDGNVPVFADEDAEPSPLELSQWVTLPFETMAVPARSEALFTFNLEVPKDAPPGSHFAGIFVSMDPPRLRESGAAIGYEIGTILIMRVSGEVIEKAEVRQFSTDQYVYGSPNVAFNAKIENSGNTLIRPIGPVEIRNMFGQRVDNEMMFNEAAGGVYPRSSREFDFTWQGEPPGFGRYTALLSAVYGEEGAKQTMSSSVTFWILPMNIILPALGILAVVLLVTFFMAHWYVRRKFMYYETIGARRRVNGNRRSASTGSPLFLVIAVMAIVTAVFMIGLLVLFA